MKTGKYSQKKVNKIGISANARIPHGHKLFLQSLSNQTRSSLFLESDGCFHCSKGLKSLQESFRIERVNEAEETGDQGGGL